MKQEPGSIEAWKRSFIEEEMKERRFYLRIWILLVTLFLLWWVL